MANKTFSFHFPAELLEAIEVRAKVMGQSRTDVVIEALAKVYRHQHDLSQSDMLESLQQLQQQLSKLDHLITIILSEPNPPEFRLTGSEQQVLSRWPKHSQQLEAAEQN